MTVISLPVLRTIATDLDRDGRAYLNMFGMVVEIYKGSNGHHISNTRVIAWDRLQGLTTNRARAIFTEMRAELAAQGYTEDEGE